MNVREQTVAIGDLHLDGGTIVPAVEQRVTIYGTPREDGSNVVLVAHALTGSSRVTEWWSTIVGEGRALDPRVDAVVCVNVLGGCYGSSGPSSHAALVDTRVTVRDIVRAQRRALDVLHIERVRAVVGGSLGGMQALQWAIDAPERVGRSVVIAAHDHHSAMGIALNAVQRECLQLNPARGLRTARKIAMLTYKSEALLNVRHGRRPDRSGAQRFDVEGYLERQADRFERRMDAATYATLTHAMDSFDVREAAYDPKRLPEIHFVGLSSDWLFRPADVRAAAARMQHRGARVRYAEIETDHGHDGFLADAERLAEFLR